MTNETSLASPWRSEFDIRKYELDCRGQLSVLFLCRMLQESAAIHGGRFQIGSEDLRKQGLTWVFAHFYLRIESNIALAAGAGAGLGWPNWPAAHEKIAVETWGSGLERIFALRDYRVFDLKENLLAAATSSFALFNIAKRCPVAIPSFIKEKYRASSGRAAVNSIEKLTVSRPDHQKNFWASYSHTDENQHVNNVAYIAWLLDTLPPVITEKAHLTEIKVAFRAESFAGEELVSVAQEDRSGDTVHFIHQIVRPKDQREIIQARTTWKI